MPDIKPQVLTAPPSSITTTPQISKTANLRKTAREMVEAHQLSQNLPLYVIGSFDRRVTVLAQQTRALNLAWAMIETGIVPTENASSSRIAVVGAGFAGLTFAAGLLKKSKHFEIDVFEQRDSLLPLQQGSDTRWLHPHIYDWPTEGSDAAAAMLPVLNWTAARSSDVVVQVLGEWAKIAENKSNLRLFCNARHLQVTQSTENSNHARIEWVGEKRNPIDGGIDKEGAARGMSRNYDAVILSVGFGLEAGDSSYWRNETLGQPGLKEARRTYLLSGQGDGAMIDLLRIRLSQFRQDRILDEIFSGHDGLLEQLRILRTAFLSDEKGLFAKFEQLAHPSSMHHDDMDKVIRKLSSRLRRDTDVVLQLLVRNVAELLDPSNSRMSFQNALLVYLLYRGGGFSPSAESERAICARFGIAKNDVIKRHGVKPLAQLARSLPEEVYDEIERRRTSEQESFGLQPANGHWPGGYFGYFGTEAKAGDTDDSGRRVWRKEYLPGPTALMATTISGSIAGALANMRPKARHYRVTLHRTLLLNGEELLQQACDYVGKGLIEASATAGRTMVASALTIGAAYQTRKIVRSPLGMAQEKIEEGMRQLHLASVARKMQQDVSFVLAIPVIQPEEKHYAPGPVAAVLYLDSRDVDFWLDDRDIEALAAIVQGAVRAIDAAEGGSLGRVRNFASGKLCRELGTDAMAETGTEALEIVFAVKPPSTNSEFVLNYDHSDLAPVTTKSTTEQS